MQSFIVVIFFTLAVYRFFLSTDLLVANDWPLLFKESRNFSPFWSLAWNYMGNGGIGSPAFTTLWIDLYTNLIYAISNSVNIPWWLSQRLFWILPFILVSLFSSYKFASLFIKESLLRVLSSIIYSFNTYILLILGGGQFGIAFAYALAPMAIYALINFFNNFNIKSLIYSSFASGFLIALDPRISFLVFLVAGVWYAVFIRIFSIKALKFLILNFSIAIFLNSYWIIPFLTAGESLSDISRNTSLEGVKFLSFANFSNSISLLHPNWPENIFGKVGFMKPEFLVLPILAYSSLLFLSSKFNPSTKLRTRVQSSKLSIRQAQDPELIEGQLKIKSFENNLTIEQFNLPRRKAGNRIILFFTMLGLLGAFLAKGTNNPFGEIYLFLFQLPGFNLFRDSTKFFVLIAISYSILIPYFFERLPWPKYILTFIFISYLLIILKPGWNGELGGIFRPREIPREYHLLTEKIKNDPVFYRTLWIPQRQKYGYFDPIHPAASAQDFFNLYDNSQILKNLRKKDTQRLVEESAVKYVIVPYDSEEEIFLKDRKYDERQYRNAVRELEKKEWLKRIGGFDKIAVFETENLKDHFFLESRVKKYESELEYKMVNPTKYLVNIKNAKKGDLLVFSEGFDKKWQLETDAIRVSSKQYNKIMNSFTLPKSGNYEFTIYYYPQRYVEAGLWVSGSTFLASIGYFLFGKIRKKW